MKTVIKAVLNIALFLIGTLAFCFIVGEPTPETNAKLISLFGKLFAGLVIVLSKAFAGLIIWGTVVVAASINPSFKRELERK